MNLGAGQRIVPGVAIVHVLDHLPDSVVHSPGRVWNVFARSLGEQGANGRTALAWRWALTGGCPSPVALGPAPGRPPGRGELLVEAGQPAELAASGDDPGGQVIHARLVLRWLAGDLDAVPLWNAGQERPHVTDSAAHPHNRAEIEQLYDWALLASTRYPWPGEGGTDEAWMSFGWAYGARQLLAWACGDESAGPLSGLRIAGRPTLYEVSLDTRRAMTALGHARSNNDATMAGRLEAVMETFLWLAGWNSEPPIDRHGHAQFGDSPERSRLPG